LGLPEYDVRAKHVAAL